MEPLVYRDSKATSGLLVHAGTPVFKAPQVYKVPRVLASAVRLVLLASRARLG